MKEIYIPFDTLKKLAAKGFPMRKQAVFAFYEEDKSVKPMKFQWDYIQERTLAPTIEEVLKWLREEKQLHIEIISAPSGYNTIISRTPPDGTDLYYSLSAHLIPNGIGAWGRSEDAALHGIEYILDNLI